VSGKRHADCGSVVRVTACDHSFRRLVPALLVAWLPVLAGCASEPEPPTRDVVRVMSFNMWVGGEAGGQPLEQSARVIQAAGADIVGLQETRGRERDGPRPDEGARLASLLGWHHLDQGQGRAIVSRWPFESEQDDRSGAAVRLPSGGRLHVFNVHLAHAPYQPYQLLRIPYEGAPFLDTSDALVEAAAEARGAQIEAVLARVRPLVAAGAAVVLTGDFNEPSHLDWTERAAAAGVVPLAVAYPSSRAVEEAGLRDAFRAVHPDEVARPGWTWTPTTAPDDPKDRHDRIDFVHAAGVDIVRAEVVGEGAPAADVVVHPWPSDHRAVVVTLEVPASR
jgi:exodeoxyribonuclease-3